MLVNIFAMPVRNPSHTQVHYCVNCIVCTYVRRVTQDASCLLPTSVDLRKKKQTNKTFSPIRAVFLPFGYFKTGRRNDDVTAERTGFILRSKPPHLRSMKTRNIFPLLKNKKIKIVTKIAQDPRRTNGGENNRIKPNSFRHWRAAVVVKREI